MKTLHETITVATPLELAFRYVSDFSNIEQWDPGVTESEKISQGPLAVGSEFRVVVKAGLTTTEMKYLVTDFDPPRRIVLEGSGGAINAVDTIEFSETGQGTRITLVIPIRGWLWLF